jgi:hypothetical protein
MERAAAGDRPRRLSRRMTLWRHSVYDFTNPRDHNATGILFQEHQKLLGDGFSRLWADLDEPLGEHDALLVVDMQADFVPQDPQLNPRGGKFGIAEGGEIIGPIVDLIDAAVQVGATVCATREYHPHDHVSFTTRGGPFPPHCVQGTPGARFLAPIATALAQGVHARGPEKVFVAFKAMHEDVDSLGALPYRSAKAATRRRTLGGVHTIPQPPPQAPDLDRTIPDAPFRVCSPSFLPDDGLVGRPRPRRRVWSAANRRRVGAVDGGARAQAVGAAPRARPTNR